LNETLRTADFPQVGMLLKAAASPPKAATLSELESNIIEAVRCHFDDSELPRAVRLHFVEDPVLSPG
jgi:hypothetical protein